MDNVGLLASVKIFTTLYQVKSEKCRDDTQKPEQWKLK